MGHGQALIWTITPSVVSKLLAQLYSCASSFETTEGMSLLAALIEAEASVTNNGPSGSGKALGLKY